MLSPVQKTTNHLCPQHFTQAHFYVPISIMIFHTPCLTTSHTLTLIHTRMLSLHTLHIVQPILTCECPHLHNSLLSYISKSCTIHLYTNAPPIRSYLTSDSLYPQITPSHESHIYAYCPYTEYTPAPPSNDDMRHAFTYLTT